MLIAFDSATARVTAALFAGGEVVAEFVDDQPMRHGEMLAPAVERVLEIAGARPADLEAIAVGVGPGPFTGLRVGIVTARTMGLALGIPVWGVCSLDVIAAEAFASGYEEFQVATDARRKEVYLACYAGGARTSGPEVVYPDHAATDQLVVGRGALLYPDAFPNSAAPLDPSAAAMCKAVADRSVALLDPEPLYLRRPDAVVPGAPKRVS